MQAKLFAAMVVALVVNAGVRADEENTWERFNSPKKDFSVLMPAKPTAQSKSVPSAAGAIDVKMYMATGEGSTVFMVASFEMPSGLTVDADNTKELLDGLVSGMLQPLKGKVTSEDEIKLGKYPGREIEASCFEGNGSLKARMYVVNQKVYMVAALAPKDTDAADDTTKFLDSFKLGTGKADKKPAKPKQPEPADDK